MNREEKQQEIELLGAHLKESQVAVCAEYRGLTVAQITQLRRELRAAGATARVVKNTLLKVSIGQALSEADKAERERFAEMVQGPSFLVFSKDDPIGTAKVLAKFVTQLEKLKIRGGWFENTFLDAEGVSQLATMPSREEVFASLLRVMSAPATQVARLVQAPGQQVARVIEARRVQLEKQAA